MKKKEINPIHRRLVHFAFLSLLAFSLLEIRLFWIQIKNHDRFKYEALRQRAKEISLYPNRGIIYDRNLIPLTNVNRKNTLLVFRENIFKDRELMDFILENTDLDYWDVISYSQNSDEILAIPLKGEVENIDISKNMFITERTERYSDNNLLSHVIGYINKSENRGESGIEKVYDDILVNQKRRNSLYLDFDDKQNIFLGGEYQVDHSISSLEPSAVKLTVDYHIQKIVEETMDLYNVNGAVVVADVETGDIMALASRPNFNQRSIEEYLEREDMTLYNKAIQVGYPPGSLFKTVVLLAALEDNLEYLDKSFYCNGYEKIGEVVIKCNKTEGHGHIDINEAFSLSCNSAFIQLGKEVGSKKIMDMAKRLGFGNRINIGLLEEISGILPEGEEIKGPAIGNISIGQGSIEVTPIQITNLMMIIANDGVMKPMSIVEGITAEDGTMIKPYNRPEKRQVLSITTSRIIKDFLIDVVEYGTARNLDLDDIGGAAGKTGSAQAILNRQETIHGWFTGFYPVDEPEYVITVIVEEGVSGAQSAVPIFEKIAKEIHRINR
ncbi:MAG TPA: hypothetical protein GXX53_01265 [Tissierellia bacterium]|nr:hypothetical protein [Tissierellia bacterium]